MILLQNPLLSMYASNSSALCLSQFITRQKWYLTSPNVQGTIWAIPGLMSYAEVTGRWGSLLLHAD